MPLLEPDKDVSVAPLAKSIEVDERTATQASATANTNNVGDSIATGPPPSSRTLGDVKRSSGPRWGILALGGVAVAGVAAFALTRPDSVPQPSRDASAATTGALQGGAPQPESDPTVTPVTGAVASSEPTTPAPSATASAMASASAAPSTTSPVVSGGQRRGAPHAAGPAPQPTAGPTIWNGPRK